MSDRSKIRPHEAEARRRAAARARKPPTAVKPIAPGRTPDVIDRDAIAEAVHQAVCIVGRSDGTGDCSAYAWAGAVVLSVVTGQPWKWQAGLAKFGTGIDRDSPEGELCFAWDPSATTPGILPDGTQGPGGGLASGEVHAWCARSGYGGDVAEVADFSARHVPVLATQSGLGWQREAIRYVWGLPEDLHRQRFWYRADQASVNTILGSVQADPDSYEDTATLALWKLRAISDHKAAQVLHAAELLGLMRDGFTITESLDGAFMAVRPSGRGGTS